MTDLTKLRVALRNFAYAPKNHKKFYPFVWASVCIYTCLSLSLSTHTHTHAPYLYSKKVLITSRIVSLCALFNCGSKLYCGFHNDMRKYCLHSSEYVCWSIMQTGKTRTIWSVCRYGANVWMDTNIQNCDLQVCWYPMSSCVWTKRCFVLGYGLEARMFRFLQSYKANVLRSWNLPVHHMYSPYYWKENIPCNCWSVFKSINISVSLCSFYTLVINAVKNTYP